MMAEDGEKEEQQMMQSIYFETQLAGSMECAVHSINNLLQSSAFSTLDLAGVAQSLDRLEQQQLSSSSQQQQDASLVGNRSSRGRTRASHNYDDSGFFSVAVIEEVLKLSGLQMVRWSSQTIRSSAYADRPEDVEGFVLNHQMHWFVVRRFAVPGRFYILDSCKPEPLWISAMHLGLTLREATNQGYSIFAILPDPTSSIHSLPPCDATTFALAHPTRRVPSSVTSSASKGGSSSEMKTKVTYFGGKGHSLASSSSSAVASVSGSKSDSNATTTSASRDSIERIASATTTSSTLTSASEARKGKRRADVEYDIDLALSSSSSSSTNTSDSESVIITRAGDVSDESERRRRRRRVGDYLALPGSSVGHSTAALASSASGPASMTKEKEKTWERMTEEEQFEEAIRASMATMEQSGANPTTTGSTSTSMMPTARRTAAAAVEKEEVGREEAELEAALLASMAGLSSDDLHHHDEDEDDDEEDDAPSVEEMRRRRLARFG